MGDWRSTAGFWRYKKWKSKLRYFDFFRIFFNKFTYQIKEIIMGKGKDSKKMTKKAPLKTAKEKRAEKRLKKAK